MLCVNGHHGRRALAALALVHRDGVGQAQLVQVREVEGDHPVVEPDVDLLLLQVDALDAADVAVEDVLVVVVPELHHLVARPEEAGAPHHLRPPRVQGGLEDRVELSGADHAAVHGRDHLDVGPRVEPVAARQVARHQVHDAALHGLRILLVDEDEVAAAIARRQGHGPLVDPVRVHHDLAGLGLAEDLGEPDHLGHAAGDDVLQHGAGSH